ncbi:MAG: uridine kinase [Xanthomonadaceae bacterium]|nr:uridine kinase [Xanthomonadaceae bacterium]
MLSKNPMYIVGIAGGSGSGKTTFTEKITKLVGSPRVAVLSQDSYYLPSPPASLRIHGESNFDHPEAFDWPLLKDHLARIKAGNKVPVPTYDYKISSRKAEVEWIGPCDVLLVEGIFTLWNEEIRSMFDLKVYLHVESDIRFIRRLHRDVRERGRSLDQIIRQYYDTVRPMYQMYLEPTRKYADIIVGEETDMAADVIASQIIRVLNTGKTRS